MNNRNGQTIFTTPPKQQTVMGFPINRYYTKAESDAKFITTATEYWTRDAINGYIYPTTITDKVAIGQVTASTALDVLGTITSRATSGTATHAFNTTSRSTSISLDNATGVFTIGDATDAIGIAFGGGTSLGKLNSTGFAIGSAAVPTHTLTLPSTSTGISEYNTADQTTNYERVLSQWSANVYSITTQAGGTGTLRDLQIGVTNRPFVITTNPSTSTLNPGFYNFVTDSSGANSINVAITGAAWRASASGSQSMLAILPTISQTSSAGYRTLWISPFENTIGSGSRLLIDAGTNSASFGSGTHTSVLTLNSTGTLSITGSASGNGRINLGTGTGTNARFLLGTDGLGTGSNFGTLGFGLQIAPATYSSTSSSGTIATQGTHTFGIPTLAASNATTLTNASTLYVDGPPVASTNMTITNPYALYVASGQSFFQGNIMTNNRVAANTTAGLASAWLYVGNNATLSTSGAYGINGFGLQVSANTYLSNAATGSPALVALNSFGIPTLTAANAQAMTNAATVYIDGAPTASTNVTVTNPYALYVNSGAALINGNAALQGVISQQATSSNSNFYSSNANDSRSLNNAKLLFGGASNVDVRVAFNGNTSTTIGANNNYANTIVGSSPLNTPATGTNAFLANLVVNPIGTVTSGGATVTNTASLYVGAAGSGGANNYALYNAGTEYMVGKQVGYNNVATTGWGVPAIYGYARPAAGQVGAVTLSTYTVGAADGSFLVSANILVTTATLHSFTVTCTYTDEGNTSRTLTLQLSTIAGAFVTAITNAQGTVPYEGVPLHIRAKAATSITLATVGTFTTVVYNGEGAITQIA